MASRKKTGSIVIFDIMVWNCWYAREKQLRVVELSVILISVIMSCNLRFLVSICFSIPFILQILYIFARKEFLNFTIEYIIETTNGLAFSIGNSM